MDDPWTMHLKNTASNVLANDSINHTRAKHMDIENHYVKNMVSSGRAKVEYKSRKNEADGFNKPLAQEEVSLFCDMICLQSIR